MRHVCSDHVFKDEHLFYRFIDVPELTLTYVEAMKEKAIATVRERLHEPYNRTGNSDSLCQARRFRKRSILFMDCFQCSMTSSQLCVHLFLVSFFGGDYYYFFFLLLFLVDYI